MKTSPETRLFNKLKGETMLVAKIILTPESPVEGIEGKRQQQLFPNLHYVRIIRQWVSFKRVSI